MEVWRETYAFIADDDKTDCLAEVSLRSSFSAHFESVNNEIDVIHIE